MSSGRGRRDVVPSVRSRFGRKSAGAGDTGVSAPSRHAGETTIAEENRLEQAVERGHVPRHAVGALVGHATLTLVLLSGCYYAVPQHLPWGDVASALRFGGAMLLLASFLLLFRSELRRVRRRYPPQLTRVQLLLTAFYLLVLAFATVYFVLALNVDGQFQGIANRTDALYFTVSTVATVGFGDVHASGSIARALVTMQMIFDLIYLGTAVRLLGVVRVDRAADD